MTTHGPQTMEQWMRRIERRLTKVEHAVRPLAGVRLEQWGTHTFDDMPSLGSGGSTFADITFPVEFANAPEVAVRQTTLVGGSQWYRPVAYNVTTTGFRLYIYNLNQASVDTAALTIAWHAVEQIQVQSA